MKTKRGTQPCTESCAGGEWSAEKNIIIIIIIFVFLPFLGPLPRQMEVPRVGVESEL